MTSLRVLTVSGSPRDMGRQHGLAYPEQIKEYTADRVKLSSSPHWTGKSLSRADILALAEACLPHHQAYAPALMEELRGLGAVTGLSLAELIIVNGFTDFIDLIYNREPVTATPAPVGLDNCTAFIVSPRATADGYGLYGQTWDMHKNATPYVILLHGQPSDGLRFLALSITGCVGMIGLNEAGIAIGINNLVASDGQVGVTWPFVVRKALAQTSLDAALACITEAPLAGAHNYMLADATGRGYNVEAMPSRHHIEEISVGARVHTNHCLIPHNTTVERTRVPQSQASSERRLETASGLLNRAENLSLNNLFDLTCQVAVKAEDPLYVETCAATVMRPATREMWAVWRSPCTNGYERFVV